MAAPQSPIGSRRRLGAELRRLRTKVGLTLDEVAERMTCSTSKISRLETGKGVPKVPDVVTAAVVCGTCKGTAPPSMPRAVTAWATSAVMSTKTTPVLASRAGCRALGKPP